MTAGQAQIGTWLTMVRNPEILSLMKAAGLALGIGVWSVMKMLTGLAHSYLTMLLVRIGLGIGEAPTNGAVSPTLRDWAPVSERGLSMAIFTGGSYAGRAFGAALSGMLVAAVGWRLSSVITRLFATVNAIGNPS